MTEPTLQAGSGIHVPMHKNMTLTNTNDKRKYVNSERQSHEDTERYAVAEAREGFSTGKNEGRSQSRTIGHFIPTQSTNSINNASSNNQHLHLSGTQQRAHILKQSKSNITSKTIGIMH